MNGLRRLGLGGLLALGLVSGIWVAGGVALASGGVTPGGSSVDDTGGSGESAFPVRAKHTYGDGIGAGRGHEGQDIMADCSRKVVAARAGRVRIVDYEASGAGRYVVVTAKGREGYDYVYMHMLRRASVREGQRVQAGDLIGRVGSTGRSTACHLHFEMWTAPGWYRGGRLEDPKPFLKRWDRND